MAESDTLEILIKARDQASKAIKDVDNAIKKLDKDTKNASDGGGGLARYRKGISRINTSMLALAGGITSMLSFGGLVTLTRSMVDAASTAENYRVRLNRLLGSVEEGNRLFDDMSEYASSVAFEYEQVMGAATALSGVMAGGVDEINQWMPLIGDLAAASGLAIEDATQQVIRMYSAGAASADLFRERGILAMLGFQAGVSYSAEETRKRLIEAYEDPMSKFRGAASDLGRTWTGMLSMISDAWFQLRNMVAEAGAFDFMKAGLLEVLDLIKELRESGDLQEFAQDTSEAMITSFEIIIKAGAVVSDMFMGWNLIWQGLKGAFALMIEGFIRGVGYLQLGIGRAFEEIGNVLVSIQERIVKITSFLGGVPHAIAKAGLEAGQALQIAGKRAEINNAALQDMADYWKDVGMNASDVINNYAAQGSYLSRADKLVDRLRGKVKELGETAAKTAEEARNLTKNLVFEPPSTASQEQANKSALKRMQANTQTSLAELDVWYQANQNNVEEYYDKREDLVRKQMQAEIDAEKQKATEIAKIQIAAKKIELEAAQDPASKGKIIEEIQAMRDKEQQINDNVYVMQQDLQRRLVSLRQSELADIDARNKKKLEKQKEYNDAAIASDRAFEDQKARLEIEQSPLQQQFTQEQIELKNQHAQELDAIRNFHAQQIQLLRDKGEEEILVQQEIEAQKAIIADTVAAQRQEKEAQLLNQDQRLWQYRMQSMAQMAGSTAQIFNDLYELTGKKQKELFVLAKAASLAQAVMKGAEAVVGALGSPPYGIGAIANAAIVATMAGIEIATIAAQSLAEGGSVKGFSPHAKSDNIPINATAGEFMQPVAAVQHYGVDVMEAIRQRAIPADLLRSFSYPRVATRAAVRSTRGFAEGGQIPNMADAQGSMEGKKQEVKITNIVDQSVMSNYMNSREGSDTIVNVIGDRAFEVNRVLSGA
jgi:hypothetical protein